MSIYFVTCLQIFYFTEHRLFAIYCARNIDPLGTTDREPPDIKRKAAVRGKGWRSDL